MLSNEMTENFLLRISSAKGVATSIADKNTINLYYGNTGCRVFKREVHNWKDFFPKDKHTQFLELVECGGAKKCLNLTFKVNFLCQKSSESFSILYPLMNINLGAHFLLLTFFDYINF